MGLWQNIMAVAARSQVSEPSSSSFCACRATKSNVIAVLILQVVVICSLPFILPSRRSTALSSSGYPVRPSAIKPSSLHTPCRYGPCRECSDIEKVLYRGTCDLTGFFHSVECSNTSTLPVPVSVASSILQHVQYISCSPSWRGPPLEFIIFQLCWLIGGCLSVTVVRLRLRHLTDAAQRRIQQQLGPGGLV